MTCVLPTLHQITLLFFSMATTDLLHEAPVPLMSDEVQAPPKRRKIEIPPSDEDDEADLSEPEPDHEVEHEEDVEPPPDDVINATLKASSLYFSNIRDDDVTLVVAKKKKTDKPVKDTAPWTDIVRVTTHAESGRQETSQFLIMSPVGVIQYARTSKMGNYAPMYPDVKDPRFVKTDPREASLTFMMAASVMDGPQDPEMMQYFERLNSIWKKLAIEAWNHEDLNGRIRAYCLQKVADEVKRTRQSLQASFKTCAKEYKKEYEAKLKHSKTPAFELEMAYEYFLANVVRKPVRLRKDQDTQLVVDQTERIYPSCKIWGNMPKKAVPRHSPLGKRDPMIGDIEMGKDGGPPKVYKYPMVTWGLSQKHNKSIEPDEAEQLLKDGAKISLVLAPYFNINSSGGSLTVGPTLSIRTIILYKGSDGMMGRRGFSDQQMNGMIPCV